MVGAMLDAIAFTMAPVTGARRARVIYAPVSGRSIMAGAERSSLRLPGRVQA
jgi:hypothetical protein